MFHSFSFDNTDHLHHCMDDLYLDIYGEKTLIRYLNIVIHFILSFNNVLVCFLFTTTFISQSQHKTSLYSCKLDYGKTGLNQKSIMSRECKTTLVGKGEMKKSECKFWAWLCLSWSMWIKERYSSLCCWGCIHPLKVKCRPHAYTPHDFCVPWSGMGRWRSEKLVNVLTTLLNWAWRA